VVAFLAFSDILDHCGPQKHNCDCRGFFAGLPTNEKRGLSKSEILAVLGDEGERWCDWVEKLPEERAAEMVTRGGAGPGGKSASRC
jgi:hypothetical protein